MVCYGIILYALVPVVGSVGVVERAGTERRDHGVRNYRRLIVDYHRRLTACKL